MSIEKQLADFKAEQDKRFEEFKASLIKPQFEVGKWYYGEVVDGTPFLIKYKCNHDERHIGHDEAFMSWLIDTYVSEYDYSSKNFIIRPATESEIKEALVKEAERRGFKEGVKIKRTGFTDFDGIPVTDEDRCNELNPYYNPNWDTLVFGGRNIYQKGKWAEIVDSPIMIGGYEMKVEGNKVSFGCKSFLKSDFTFIKKIMESNNFKSIRFDDHESVSLETINQILEKLK